MIIGLLEQFKDDTNYSSLLADLSSIKSIYAGLSLPSDLTEAEMASLSQKVKEVREKIVAH